VASLDILGNVVPYIADEEPKIEAELARLLGGYVVDDGGGRVEPAGLRAGAHANRVAVEHGHTVCLSVGFARRPSPATSSTRCARGAARPRWPTRSQGARPRPCRRSSCSTRPTGRSRAAT
jgi:aspartate-semialdehyde dehydrogenase